MQSSVIQGSTAHSSNNPGMLYWTPCWHLAQDCNTLSNIASPIVLQPTYQLGSSTVRPCMHTSQRVKEYHKNTHGNWQLSLRVEEKPLSSHDRRKLASGLSGGIDATAHALRVNRHIHTVYSAQPIYTLSYAIASSGKVKKLRIRKWRQNWRTTRFRKNLHKSWVWNAIRNLTTPQIGLANEVCSS